jgi:hypothetical protein
VIQKLGQHRAVELPQKGLKRCLDYREPPRVRRGNSRTWFQKFYQNGGGILVLAETNVRRRGHGLPLLLFTRRGTAECELCLQFRNLFAKRCQLILYSSGSGIHI